MKLTLGWLKQHLETAAPLEAIVERLTMLGLEVEGVDDRAKTYAPFTVAYVVEAKPHPNADRLKVCIVETALGRVQVVCGAPNAHTGMKGVFAPAGTHIPGTGLDLVKSTIRGVESNGMLLSERELGLSDNHEGIVELDPSVEVGASYAKLMGLDDPVIDVAITPNRADCLGVRGIARDLAAAGIGTLKPDPRLEPVPGKFESPIAWRRDLPDDASGACPFVVGRYFRGLKNGPSPRWLQDRLVAIGLRPISALVDITNFVTFDLGRPLHVFDAQKLAGDLTMRLARAGETMAALNGKSYALDESMTVIADARGVQGIGGIIGGEASGCGEGTTEMFLEVALFDPVRTAATGRKLQIDSDARYRFERGLDPTSALWGAEVAARLVLELCGGEASKTVSAGEMPAWQRTVVLPLERVRTLGGIDLAPSEQKRILASLGYELADKAGAIEAMPPPWRGDVGGPADLVEDILRVNGYDKVAPVPMTLATALPQLTLTPSQRRARTVKRALAARGLMEAVTWSFASARTASLFGANEALTLANPISSDLDIMRPSILPNLIAAAGRNADRGVADFALFEVGPQYADATPDGQSTMAAGLRVGQSGPRHWAAPPREVDAFDAKADALAVILEAGGPAEVQVTRDAPGWYHPGQSGTLRLGPSVLGWFGAVHPKVLAALDVKGQMAAFEVFLDRVPSPRAKSGKLRPLLKASPFQPVERDFAFVVDAGVEAAALMRAAKGADKALISNVSVFDLYQGKGVAEGKKSIALSVSIQPTERTLTEAEIEAISAKIVAAVAKATGAALRT
ncbi:MAG TPA: phenylalanine--tRNA ligase subunit beta [Alphaproteobacteria bacterium]|nr:phenylalanine--tRNA ligase subunit beta [Alphaproteobacteria bacterium]